MPQSPVCYNISFEDASAHYFDVCLEIKPEHQPVTLSLPAWLPGSYMIRDFARNLDITSASSNDIPLEITQLDKQSWQLESASGPIQVIYRVYAWDLSVRAAHLDLQHGFFNPSSLCLKVHGCENLRHEVTIHPSSFAEANSWKVATGMPSDEIDKSGFGRYKASSYDELLDYPFEMGTFEESDFIAGSIPHRMVYTGAQRGALNRISEDVQKICQTQLEMFGDEPPFSNYLFMTMVVGNGFGGLEHRNSTALVTSRKSLVTTETAKQTDEYRTFLSLCSHEYFHSWNVKRIKPAEFTPFELSQEQYTKQLWAYEGITSYYDDLFLCRADIVEPQTYLNMLSKTLSRVSRGNGRTKQTVTDSSFNAWTKFYKQDENAPNAIVSYYTKGAEIALCLDLLLRKHSEHAICLDDLMRLLWQRHGVTETGTEPDTIQNYCAELLTPHCEEANAILAVFFYIALDSTDPLPTAELLEWVGVRYKLRPPHSPDDKGGPAPGKTAGNHLGALFSADPSGVKITTTYEGEPAQKAGLAAGDIVIAIGNTKVTQSTCQQVLNEFMPGEKVTVHAFRHDQLFEAQLMIETPPATLIELTLANAEKAEEWLFN